MPGGRTALKSNPTKHRLRLLNYLLSGAAQYAWRSCKDVAKKLIGRKCHIDERALFFRQYILHLIGIRPISTITCIQRTGIEGAGAQAHLVMNAINFASLSGLAYRHTPFSAVEHADRPMPEWVAAWESLFNLGAGEIPCALEPHEVVNYGYPIFDDLALCFGERCARERQSSRFKELVPEFKRKYYLNRPRRTTKQITVAVHIRRGDVPARNSDLYTHSAAILQTIRAVQAILAARRLAYTIRIYSQGDIADFQEFAQPTFEFFLNADALKSMQELIEADVLILAKSSFSYYAGIISDGIKIFEPQSISPATGMSMPSWDWMLLPPIPDDWLPANADGSFDPAAFERRLSTLTQARHA